MPGVSRSGITISAARFLGFNRDSAARLSFLLLIPTTFGAVLEGVTDVLLADLPDGWQGPFVVDPCRTGERPARDRPCSASSAGTPMRRSWCTGSSSPSSSSV